MRKNPKTKRREAERAAEWYAHEIEGCTHTIRAVRTKWQWQDLFGCDVLGKRPDGSCVWIQVTAGGAEAARRRRRKLEQYPWSVEDTVLFLQLVHTEDPDNARRKLWWFRIWRYEDKKWHREERVSVPRKWFSGLPRS